MEKNNKYIDTAYNSTHRDLVRCEMPESLLNKDTFMDMISNFERIVLTDSDGNDTFLVDYIAETYGTYKFEPYSLADRIGYVKVKTNETRRYYRLTEYVYLLMMSKDFSLRYSGTPYNGENDLFVLMKSIKNICDNWILNFKLDYSINARNVPALVEISNFVMENENSLFHVYCPDTGFIDTMDACGVVSYFMLYGDMRIENNKNLMSVNEDFVPENCLTILVKDHQFIDRTLYRIMPCNDDESDKVI